MGVDLNSTHMTQSLGKGLRRWSMVPALLALGGCELWPADAGYPYTTTEPITDFAMATHELYASVTYIVLVIFALVSALLAYTLIKFRDDGSEGNPEQIHGNTQMEIGWTLIPVFIVISLIIPTVRTIFQIADAAPEDSIEIKVTGMRWWWAFEYVESGVVTANQLHIPDDRPVSFQITSDTVIHSFWVPRLGGKRDAVPGRVNRIWFNFLEEEFSLEPGETEEFLGECAEYCGEAHALMRFTTIAMDGPDFDAWIERMQEGPFRPEQMAANADLAKIKEDGEAAFSSGTCVTCHSITGNDAATGVIGPNLTAFGERRMLAAGLDRLRNSEGEPVAMDDGEDAFTAHVSQWLRDPDSVKPGTTQMSNPSRGIDGMNIPELSEEQIATLVAYLRELK